MDNWNESKPNSTFAMEGDDVVDEYHEGGENYDSADDDNLKDLPDFLRRYDEFHYSIHGWLTLIIIIIGTIGNIITMIVLTKKPMKSTINIILTALAFADMMVLVTYLVKIKFHSDLQFMSYTEVTYSLAVFCMHFSHFFILFHTVSAWLTVVVALWRVMSVCYPAATTNWRSAHRAKIAIGCTFLACALICIPEFLKKKIHVFKDAAGNDTYVDGDSDMYLANKGFFDPFDDWVFNVVLYMLPCILLTGFTVSLVKNIYRNRQNLQESGDRSSRGDPTSKRITVILVFILVVFLAVKIPPGIMYMLESGLGSNMVHQVHYAFSGTVNTMILVNSSVNFFIYFCMSPAFRAVAYNVFCMRLTGKARSAEIAPHQRLETEIELSKY